MNTMTPRLREVSDSVMKHIKLKGDVETVSGFFKGEFLTSNLGVFFLVISNLPEDSMKFLFKSTEDFPVFRDFFWFGDWW